MRLYDANFRMKLSCSSCRARKLKCDRAEPKCSRCQTSGVECVYRERRRPRAAPHRIGIHRLDYRREALGEQVGSNSTIETRSANSVIYSTPTRPSESPGGIEFMNCESDHATKTWVYQMVSSARDSLEKLSVESQSKTVSRRSQAQSSMSNAIACLDTALVQLATSGHSGPRSDNKLCVDPRDHLLLGDMERYVDTFVKNLPRLTLFSPFENILDPKFMRVLPYIVDSPYAQINPVLRVIYYNALYFGQSNGTTAEHRLATRSYYKCLQSVPAWLESAEGSQLDLLAASFTAWTAINCFDYHLSWQFHCEACRFGNLLGIHNVESSQSNLTQGDFTEDVKRRLHWHLVQTDFLFRLWYDKPTALKCPVSQVQLPMVVCPQVKQPKQSDSVLFLVWARVLFLLDEYFRLSGSSREEEGDRIGSKVDHCCNQIEELIIDWDVLLVAKSPKLDSLASWLYADSIIAFYSFILFMRRRAPASGQKPHPQAVKAARIVIRMIIEWPERNILPSGEVQGLYMHLVTFYPFCAFFTLYYHILSSTAPSEYEEDLQSLERVVDKMSQVASVRPEFAPITHALRALNHVTRAVHLNPESARDPTILFPAMSQRRSHESKSPELSKSQADCLQQQHQKWQQEQGLSATEQPLPPCDYLQSLSALPMQMENDFTVGMPFQLQNRFAHNFEAASGANHNHSTADTSWMFADPIEFVRAVETELARRNWHDSWWASPGKND